MVKENNRDDGDVKLFPKIIGIASLLKNEPSTSHRSENWPSLKSNLIYSPVTIFLDLPCKDLIIFSGGVNWWQPCTCSKSWGRSHDDVWTGEAMKALIHFIQMWFLSARGKSLPAQIKQNHRKSPDFFLFYHCWKLHWKERLKRSLTRKITSAIDECSSKVHHDVKNG